MDLKAVSIKLTSDNLNEETLFYYCNESEQIDIYNYLESCGYEPYLHTLKKVDASNLKQILNQHLIDHLEHKALLAKSREKYNRDKDKLEKDKKRLDDEIEKFHSKKMKFIKERDSHKSDSDTEEDIKKPIKKKK